ncbi:probable nucleolar complex protein 14 [Oryza sativa Japonica Group]|uniref:Expressed protein n=1 Tax=Oryza sativa subsp. japonica TaxID=39947 RepID=Q2R109_ORYSJ|nr:glutamic acid-rich protein [Oryza sativa Japonica Group]ABA94838.1 expressed protein [Oryza sativa Japonica Group]BAT14916.1 Os11g0623200 [Oryza sativa Japonica Group]
MATADDAKVTRRKVRMVKAVVYEVEAAATAGEGDTPVAEGKVRLSQESVDAILAEETKPYPNMEYFRSLKDNPAVPPELYEKTMRAVRFAARSHDKVQQGILRRQAWIRSELEEKGFVDVDQDKAATFTAVHWKEELMTDDEEDDDDDDEDESEEDDEFDEKEDDSDNEDDEESSDDEEETSEDDEETSEDEGHSDDDEATV